MIKLEIARDSWPIAGAFTIARGSKTAAETVTVRLSRNGVSGWGECVPYARYNESVDGVIAALEQYREAIEAMTGREGISALALPYAARNALDCAWWDLQAKESGVPAWQRANVDVPRPVTTAYTISLGEPDAMAAAARAASHRPLLKIKLGREGDADRLSAVRAAAPEARLIIDANEGWREDMLAAMLDHCARCRVELVEQPLPAASDDALRGLQSPVPVCADESAHGLESLDALAGKYQAINLKLDKTGGLTPALALAQAAKAKGFLIMVGCMVGTSLAMAPAHLLTGFAEFVDLDGPLLLARDRDPPIVYEGGTMLPPPRALWG